ncbi:MAG TPA: HAD-IA family hydrolase [Planctomycetaceae bacterium]|nr:HAD-IA family hydrolase [Planctomycetaceae bacterium]
MNVHPFESRRIRWIAFDAVGTLIHPNPPAATIYHRIGARHGSQLAPDVVATRFYQAVVVVAECDELDCGCRESGDRLHTCETRELLRWQGIVRSVLDDAADPEACFQELFAYFGQPRSWACFPEVGAALKRLQQAGFRLAICSNFDGRLNAVMESTPALSPIELRVISSDVGYRKPSARFFEALVRAADCGPSEILFIGDDPANDVAAARAAGLSALQIDRNSASVQNRTLHSLDELLALVI